MPTVDFTKTSFEEYLVDIDFTDKNPPSATSISSATFSAEGYSWPNGSKTDATSTVLDSPTGTIVDSVKARVKVKAGSDGSAYNIMCQATWNDGQKTEHGITMLVEDTI